MKKEEIYFWFSEYNYNDECYTVFKVDDVAQEYLLLRIRVGEINISDFWRVSFRYFNENKDMFVKVENDTHYRELVKERRKKFQKDLAV